MPQTKPPFNTVLSRIRQLAGQEFETITGLPFTYSFDASDRFCHSRSDYPTTVRNLEYAYDQMPVDQPSDLKGVRANSYIWSVLHDKRVSRNEW